MKGMTQYGAVATKIRGMRARLLSDADYSRLAACRSVHDLAVILKSYPGYSTALEGLDPDNMRREELERVIVRAIFIDIDKISHFLDKEHKDFLNVYRTHFDLRLVNDVLRVIFSQYSEMPNLEVYRPMFEDSKNFSFDKVIAAKTVDELIAALDGSEYQVPIIQVKGQIQEPSLFDYETSVNRFLFSDFWKKLNQLKSSEDRKSLLDTHGYEIDMLNILCVYRTKAYYNVPQKEIWRYLIPAGYKLKRKDLAQMVTAPDADTCFRIACTTFYGKYIDSQNPKTLEDTYRFILAQSNRRSRKNYPYSFAPIEAYIFNKREEIDRLVSIIESVRYGYDSKLILDVLKIKNA